MTATTHLTWPQLQEHVGAGRPLVLGVGSYEQHGPHLPLTTDALIADALAGAVAARVDGAVLPTIGYGAPSRPRSGGGDAFPAPAARLQTLLATVHDVARGAVDAGARRLVVVSWHFENAAVLWDALREPLTGGVARAVLFDAPWSFLTPELERELFGDAEPAWPEDHAGVLETAVLRHLAPELVGEPPAPVAYRARTAYDVLPTPVDAVPATGVVNDARAVAADTGRRCVEAMVSGMVAAVTAELGAP